MGNCWFCNDQTLSEGYIAGLTPRKLSSLSKQLLTLGFGTIDIPMAKAVPKPWFSKLIEGGLVRGRIRPCAKQVKWVKQFGIKQVSITYLHLPEQDFSNRLVRALEMGQELDLGLCVDLQNASTLSLSEIENNIFPVLEKYQVQSFCFGDMDGLLEPLHLYESLSRLKQRIPCRLEFCGTNHYGFATANAVSALQAGAESVATSVGGIGKWGYAPFEEVTMAAKHLLQQADVRIKAELAAHCTEILGCFGLTPETNKPVIGSNIFAHESGLHIFGITKNPSLYEPFSPDEVGVKRHLVLGKHSGTTSLKIKLEEAGLQLEEPILQFLLSKVRRMVIRQKKPLTVQQLLKICQMEGINP